MTSNYVVYFESRWGDQFSLLLEGQSSGSATDLGLCIFIYEDECLPALELVAKLSD